MKKLMLFCFVFFVVFSFVNTALSVVPYYERLNTNRFRFRQNQGRYAPGYYGGPQWQIDYYRNWRQWERFKLDHWPGRINGKVRTCLETLAIME